MKDSATGKRIVVRTEGKAGPYIAVSSDQAPAVRKVLDANGIRYSFEPHADKSALGNIDSFFNFGDGADTDRIQRALDTAE